AYRRAVVAGKKLPRGMNRFLPAILGVPPARVREVWVNDRARGSGQSHYGLARTFVVLRDLVALPLLARRLARGGTPAWRAAVLPLLVAAAAGVLVGLAAAPMHRLSTLIGTILVAGLTACALLVAFNVARFARAQEEGVFCVRRIL